MDLNYLPLFILFLPLLSASVVWFLNDRLAQFVSVSLVSVSALFSLIFFAKGGGVVPVDLHLFKWIDLHSFDITFSLYVDRMSVVMMCLITSVSALVHLYSIGYMGHDKAIPRFMALLSFFTFAMLFLVTGGNFIQLFAGWEGVGLASYLLIGFWFEKESASKASFKAFFVNRIGDWGLMIAIGLIFAYVGTLNIHELLSNGDLGSKTILVMGQEFSFASVVGILLLLGAMGKSAQLGLHVWLPDAMEGPTPVSALIHAATMVTAGVFLLSRMSPLLEYAPVVLSIIVVIGAVTALFASTVALGHNDIKKVIAYSTCSQLGYMFFAVGVSAYPAAMFHLFTHGFFKALLFLCAGSVIFYMHHDQDMRKMGGLAKKMKFTCVLMWIGSLALMGVPFFSGYYSKDMILEASFASGTFVGNFAFLFGLLGSVLTSLYSLRLLWLVFHKKPEYHEDANHHHHHDDHGKLPMVMKVATGVLSLGALFVGVAFAQDMVGEGYKAFWGDGIKILHSNAMEGAHHVPTWVVLLPLVAIACGVGLSFLWNYLIGLENGLRPAWVDRFLYNGWYFDSIYSKVFVRPIWYISNLLNNWCERFINNWIIDGSAFGVWGIWKYIRVFINGQIYYYSLTFIFWISISTCVIFFFRG